MVNFKLKKIDDISPAGQEPNLRLSWYWLTDGDLWLTFGNETIYEYTQDALAYFGGSKTTAYNDYYLVRFLEDFSELFEKISESIPDRFYDLTIDFRLFERNALEWLDLNDSENDDIYFNKYDKLISWIQKRSFDSAHLIGGPILAFFRHNDKIRAAWKTDHVLENGISLWTAKNGWFEMDYFEFVEKAKLFGEEFFAAMDKQIELTIKKDWGSIEIDKQRLIEEHNERKQDFAKNFSFLTQTSSTQTDWTEIENLYTQMISEVNTERPT